MPMSCRSCATCRYLLLERALPFVTVYSGRPQINMLDAAPEVLASLPGMTQERFNAISGTARDFAGKGKAAAA